VFKSKINTGLQEWMKSEAHEPATPRGIFSKARYESLSVIRHKLSSVLVGSLNLEDV